MNYNFEWDEEKALSNLSKHRVSFDLASKAFLDPLHLLILDREVDSEERWHLIGTPPNAGFTVLLVVHTNKDDGTIRIISARLATSHERRRYEEGDY